ncbi:MAG: hypothetical protein WD136_00845 [Cyanobium sp.]
MNPEASTGVARRFGMSIFCLWLLILLTAIAVVQRALFRRSGLSPLAVESFTSQDVAGFDLKVFRVRPEPFSADTYQVAYFVESLKPEFVLRKRKLMTGPQGEVAIGLNPAGELTLQTCLMDNGRAAVTHTRMLEAVQTSSSAPLKTKLSLLWRGVLLGYPMTSRPCLLVQLMAMQLPGKSAKSSTNREAQLLQVAWPLLETLKPAASRHL